MNKCIITASFILVFLTQFSNGQGVCVREPLKVDVIEGRVVAVLDRREDVIEQGEVTIRRESGKRILRRGDLEKEGRFSFAGLANGRYALTVRHPHLALFDIVVVLLPAKSDKEATNEIVGSLGADLLSPCNGSKAEVRKKRSTSN